MVFYSPVLEVFGLHLRHLAAGEVKHLLAEQLEDDHVVLAEALAGPTGTHDVADEGGPVFGPFLLQDLRAEQGHHPLPPLRNPSSLPFPTCTRIMLSLEI